MNSLKEVRFIIILLATGLFFSGITAVPLEWELDLLQSWFDNHWFELVGDAVVMNSDQYPFMFYGTDWLAFAHVILAILIAGTFKKPQNHQWIFEFGMIACVLIIPVAIVMGHVREIPWGWRIIDMCFALLAFPMFWRARVLCLRIRKDRWKNAQLSPLTQEL